MGLVCRLRARQCHQRHLPQPSALRLQHRLMHTAVALPTYVQYKKIGYTVQHNAAMQHKKDYAVLYNTKRTVLYNKKRHCRATKKGYAMR
jgi:hypothetical protein